MEPAATAADRWHAGGSRTRNETLPTGEDGARDLLLQDSPDHCYIAGYETGQASLFHYNLSLFATASASFLPACE